MQPFLPKVQKLIYINDNFHLTPGFWSMTPNITIVFSVPLLGFTLYINIQHNFNKIRFWKMLKG